MRQQIILPWRDTGEPWRKKHFDFLVDYYNQDFDIVIGNNDGDFNRSAARNHGVRHSHSDIAVVIDADNFIPLGQIWSAIEKADATKGVLVKPFDWFGYLTEESTNLFYETYNDPITDFAPTYIDPPEQGFAGGAYVMRKSVWEGIGGMDEGFIGWWAEDDAFHIRCTSKGIKTFWVDGYDYHLYHPAHRVTSDYNMAKLMRDYRKE